MNSNSGQLRALAPSEAHPQENTAGFSQQLLALACIACICFVAIKNLRFGEIGAQERVLVSLSAIGFWRWGWALTHTIRAISFRYLKFPLLRRKAQRLVDLDGNVPQLSVVATTYHEHAWITDRVVRALVQEFSKLSGVTERTELVFVTGGDEDDERVESVFNDELEAVGAVNGIPWPPRLTLLRGADGKRSAIAKGLRHMAEKGIHPEGVLVLMDGDSEPTDGALGKILPIFRLNERIGAVTTNERATLEGPTWFIEWIKLRFGQRHFYMCSLALSRKLLCLTGRMSAFRADVATNPSFIDQIENDHMRHWLFGDYKMFSGDDKSTWYWLNANRYDLMYVPDAMVVTYEVIDEGGIRRAIANMQRWSGNMLRNAGRAAALGPMKLRLFPWLCTVDQQVSMWTVLIGPVAIALAALSGYTEFVAAYVLWLLLTRTARVSMSWVHGRRISLWYIPIQLFSEWVGAMVKIWVYFHPVKQTWLNRGNRTLDSSKHVSFRRTRQTLANYYYGISLLCFLLFVGSYTQLIPLLQELPLVTGASDPAEVERVQALEPSSRPAVPQIGRSDAVFFGAETEQAMSGGPAHTLTVASRQSGLRDYQLTSKNSN